MPVNLAHLICILLSPPQPQVVRRVVASAGPALNETTTPEQVRLYDDLSTWTGERDKVLHILQHMLTQPDARGL